MRMLQNVFTILSLTWAVVRESKHVAIRPGPKYTCSKDAIEKKSKDKSLIESYFIKYFNTFKNIFLLTGINIHCSSYLSI